MVTRYLVTGRRKHGDPELVDSALSNLILHPLDAIIVHGNARPPRGEGESYDRLAGAWGRAHGADVRAYSADWNRYGHAAGPIRNTQMLDEERPDVVIAFPGGRGTADMVRQARLRGIVVVTVTG